MCRVGVAGLDHADEAEQGIILADLIDEIAFDALTDEVRQRLSPALGEVAEQLELPGLQIDLQRRTLYFMPCHRADDITMLPSAGSQRGEPVERERRLRQCTRDSDCGARCRLEETDADSTPGRRFAAPPAVMAELRVRLQPRARADEVVGERSGAVVIRVSAPPVDGKANLALCSFIARTAGVPRGQVTILHGAGSRDKLVRVEGMSEARLRQALGLGE